MNRVRRSVVAVSTAVLLCLFTALSALSALSVFSAVSAVSASASAGSPAGGIKGDPQPELSPFRFSTVDSSPTSTAMEPYGSIVTAFDAPAATTGKIVVCQLNRGGRSCSHTTSIGTPSSMLGVDTTYGPSLLVPSSHHVVVLEDTCCDNNTAGDTLFYSSTDGGTTFGAPVRIGGVTVADAVLAGKQIVFVGADSPVGGTQVESVPVAPSGPPASVATLSTAVGPDTPRISGYHGGVLAAWDLFTKTSTNTFVKYASSGSNFNASGSYHSVITISGQSLLGLWGNALLTIQVGGKQTVELRLFNGKTFGPSHAVPGTSGGGPEWFGIYQDPAGEVHVFSERGLSSPTYELVMESTFNGTAWSKDSLGNAITSNSFSAALDSRHAGLVIGTGGSQVWGYPLMQPQSVKFSLKSSTIKKGQSTTASGAGAPPGTGRLVSLQIERLGRWYTVATTKEKSTGSFSFTIKGTSAGKFSYRAVVSDLAGYLQFGYSAARTLQVTG